MGVLLELQCINMSDPATDECYSYNQKGMFESADDTQADVLRALKHMQSNAEQHGWRHAKLAQGKKGMLCPSCAKLYVAQTGQSLPGVA